MNSQEWQHVLPKLVAYLKPFRTKLTIGLVCGALSAQIMPLTMWRMKDFIENTASAVPHDIALQKVLPICASVVGLYSLLLVFRYGQGLFLSEVAQRVGMRIRSDVYKHLQDMPLSFFHQQRTGALMATLTNDVQRLQNAATFLKDAIIYPIQVVAYAFILFRISWQLTLIALVAVPIMAFAIGLLTKKLRSITRTTQARLSDVANLMEETLSAPRIIKAFSAEAREVARFNRENEAAFTAAMRGIRRTALLSPMVDWIGAFAIAAILYLGTAQRINAGNFVVFIASANLLSTSISGVGNLRGAFEEMMGAAERIYDQILDKTPEIRDADGAIALETTQGRIAFENVHFAYEASRPVLQDIDLVIEPGQIVAFVGATGAGKSTLADLVPRFYDPTSGRVTLDGHDLRSLTVGSLRQHIGIVPQDTVLFSGSIRENIAYGKPDATDDEIIAAACAANAHSFILEQSKGYDTHVGERGATLSGGQQQRLAIARALLANPKILILDEATSALDTQTEALVKEALDTLMKGRTTIIIAHRLSTIATADKIVVLQNGKIRESGSHAELIQHDGIYAALYRTQQMGVELG